MSENENSIGVMRERIERIDAEMAALFEKRMECSASIAAYKKENGIPILDREREKLLIERNLGKLSNPDNAPYYREFLNGMLGISKKYQRSLFDEGAESTVSGRTESIRVNIPGHEYDIRIARGILSRIGSECNLDRRVLIVTDRNVPPVYAQTVASEARDPVIAVIDGGEEGKNLDTFATLQQFMLDNGFTRKDCVVAVGGGVVGDVAAFAASCYMRGIEFINVPTTVLSQVDSSIGGKSGVNFGGVKNIVGSFWQPSKVIIDPEVLDTLDERQKANGFAEAIKMALTFDAELFKDIEEMDATDDLTPIIVRAIDIKRRVVEQDEREAGLRKVLNFGHTLGHGIEVSCGGKLLHGECVAAGMTVMCAPEVRKRLSAVLSKFSLPEHAVFDPEHALEAVSHDKKGNGSEISAIYVPEVGTYEIRPMSVQEAKTRLELILGA